MQKKQGVHSARGQAGTVLLQCATGDTEDSFACRRCRRNAQNTVYIRLMGEFACRVYSHFLPSPLNHSHSHSHSREKGSYVPSFHGNFMGPTWIPESCSPLYCKTLLCELQCVLLHLKQYFCFLYIDKLKTTFRTSTVENHKIPF